MEGEGTGREEEEEARRRGGEEEAGRRFPRGKVHLPRLVFTSIIQISFSLSCSPFRSRRSDPLQNNVDVFFPTREKKKRRKKNHLVLILMLITNSPPPPPMDVPRKNSALLFLKCIFLIIAKSLVNERGVMVHLFYITLIKD